MRRIMTVLIVILLHATAAKADGDEKQILYAATTTAKPIWRQTSTGMTPDEYHSSVNHNRAIIKQQLQVYADRLLARTGEYGQAVELFGAVAAVAMTDRRYNLNDSKTLGMVLRDTASSDRTVLLEYRKHW